MNDSPHPIDPTKHSMKRRAPWHNYRSPGTYMLTLAVEGRRALLGRLILSDKLSQMAENRMQPTKEHPERPVPEHTMLRPHVALSPLGETILKEVIGKINHYHPKVEVWRVCIMPDHIHLIVHVKEQLPEGRGLGRVVNGIKQGSNKVYTATTLDETHPERPVPEHTMLRLFEPGYNDRLLFNGEQLER